MLSQNKAEALLITKLDRLTRSVKDLGFLVEKYFASGEYSLLSVSDSIDTRSPSGRLVLNVLGSVAQWEREAIVERTKEAMAEVKAQDPRERSGTASGHSSHRHSLRRGMAGSRDRREAERGAHSEAAKLSMEQAARLLHPQTRGTLATLLETAA